MKRKNKTQFVLLGILAQKSSTGYDLKKYIDENIGSFWKESYGQLYPSLKNLVKQKFATVKISKTKSKQVQKTYTITDAGLDFIRLWLLEDDYEIPIVRNELLLKLFFSLGIEDEIIIQRLSNYNNKAQERLEALQKRATKYQKFTSSSKIQRNWFMAINHEILQTEAQIKWIQQSLKLINGSQ